MAKKQKQKYLKGSRLWGLFLFALLLFIDQLTKAVADVYFVDVADAPSKLELLPGIIELQIAWNRGVAFSLLQDSDKLVKMAIVFGTALIMVVLTCIYLCLDKRRSFLRVAIVLIVAGGVGNFIDRFCYQVWNPETATGFRDGVRDMVYLDFSGLLKQWFGWETNFMNFGVCNFADFFIVIGAVMLIFALLFFDRDALIPVGKYRVLANEQIAKEETKKMEKRAEKAKKYAEMANKEVEVAQRHEKRAEKANAKVEKANAKKGE